jgi:hypothetical protein
VLRFSPYFLYLDRMAALGEKLEIQTILPLALASLVFGCGGQLSLDEAGLLDAVAFVIGGQQEGAIPQGFETRSSAKPMIRIPTAATCRSALTKRRRSMWKFPAC